MARLFTAASSQYLSLPSVSPVQPGNASYSIFAWARLNSATATMTVVGKMDVSTITTSSEYGIRCNTTPNFHFVQSNNSTFDTVTSSASVSTGTWYAVLAWYDSSGPTINISVNGAENTLSVSRGPPSTTSGFSIGRLGDFAGQYWDGRIGLVGVWKGVVFSSDERAALTSGRIDPRLMRPTASAGWALEGGYSPEPDWTGTLNNISLVGSPTQANNPPARLFSEALWGSRTQIEVASSSFDPSSGFPWSQPPDLCYRSRQATVAY